MARAGNGRKTVRFTSVVERSGHPRVHTLWVAPEKDQELQRALAAHRVMTLERGDRGKSEHGVIGFDPRQHTFAQLLVFPKSLKSFEGARVVGVKFDLIEQPDIVAARGETESRRTSREKTKREPEFRRATPPERSEETTLRREETSREPGERANEEIPRATPSRVPVHAPRRKRSAARPTSRRPTEPRDPALVREVRAALRELKEGKAVLAYQRLERAIAD